MTTMAAVTLLTQWFESVVGVHEVKEKEDCAITARMLVRYLQANGYEIRKAKETA